MALSANNSLTSLEGADADYGHMEELALKGEALKRL
jgi:hypothetical protein